MILIAAVEIPTSEEIDGVIREAEQILIDAVFDDILGSTGTRTGTESAGTPPGSVSSPGSAAPRAQRVDVIPRWLHSPWARSPPPVSRSASAAPLIESRLLGW